MDDKEAAQLEAHVIASLSRLAFSESTDAVRLLGPAPENEEEFRLFAKSLDLYNVSEFRMPKQGQLDVKYYDRFEALRQLWELVGKKAGGDEAGFYAAMRESAAALEKHRREAGDEA